mgnify:CR=1 FL=1
MPTAIALCADDFAQHAGIDAAVFDLLKLRRLSAVSCMSDAPRWQSQAAPAMREHSADAARQFDLGLHFNLTEGYGNKPCFSLPHLLLQSHLRAMNMAQLRLTWQRQLDAFETGLKQSPDFIDGHQHAHQLPQIRDALLEILLKRYANKMPWIRNTVPANSAWGGKSRLLAILGGKTLADALRQHKIASNHGFAGVYDFAQADYAACFAAWLTHSKPGTLLMCHPANALHDSDPISAQRLVEYAFFCSDRMPELLAQHQCQLQRLSRC